MRRQWTLGKLDTLSVLDRLDGDREQDVFVHVAGTETRDKPDHLHVMRRADTMALSAGPARALAADLVAAAVHLDAVKPARV